MNGKATVAGVVAGVVGLLVGLWWGAPQEAGGTEEITALLHEQDAAWNRGDLDGFMRGYWKDPELTFYHDDKVEKGYEGLRERYRKKYQAGGKDLGKLTFSDLDVRRTGDWATARGRWQLEKDGQKSGGLFTLLLRRMGGEWKIVHDHTSAAEAKKAEKD
jgi:beta-aspartyl-peptidase (threonine type)